MYVKLFLLYIVVVNEIVGEWGIYMESEDFIVIMQCGKLKLFKCYLLLLLKFLVIIIENKLFVY